ncbi:MAG: hypothetical protein QGG54_13610 [Gammaproteobacteria bacterium]|jgi:hypothetical protein|nr:hypothetical protein [Gammaproteobacteria bacterium]MDP6537419.1 hypothetical protein [Gammaproteobacteria bacterium]MDP6733410.1 hypothetical protein [Gammaproteobacteria bacterium]HAJ76282.1 hypothetical protein [Gammaproteobacteria bacterium]
MFLLALYLVFVQSLVVIAAELPNQAVVSNADGQAWNLLIALFVLLASVASAALPVAALRQWQGYWRLSAGLSLAVLGAWLGLIFISRLFSADAHRLWALEIFAWSMLNMIYMVALMTIKRASEKADQKNTLSD